MPSVFISYARSTEVQAERVAEALRSLGYEAWRDDQLPAHRPYGEVIEERLKNAEAVIVLWSADSARSQWVRAEADAARILGTLVQADLDGTIPPMPFNQIQCADLKDWDGTSETAGWLKLQASVAALAGPEVGDSDKSNRKATRDVSVCVLPFANMSGDPEQEYFSDGISEDITTDLSKMSALEVIARNTAFQFKGQSVDACDIAKKLGVSHLLEGSVRKAGGRVRITAQLIDGRSGGHVWAERYDRDLTDIFAIQDEISHSIVDALKLKLLPEEKKAIDRGTENVDAYNLYLMARQQWISGVYGDIRKDQSIVRICKQAVTFDPNYAQAWALMALAQAELRFWHGISTEDALPAAERALAINPDLPEGRCVRARYLEQEGREEEANREVDAALRLDPDSWEVNREAARLLFREGRFREAIPFFEKATDLMKGDFHSPGMLMSCYRGIDDEASLHRAAELVVDRAEAAILKDPSNAAALAKAAAGLVILGQSERAREWVERALLLDPENVSMLYNLGCALTCEIKDEEAALDMFERFFEHLNSTTILRHSYVDPDLDGLRDHPRFKAALAAAEKRLGIKPRGPTTPAAVSMPLRS
jgi:adenylate cyclase